MRLKIPWHLNTLDALILFKVGWSAIGFKSLLAILNTDPILTFAQELRPGWYMSCVLACIIRIIKISTHLWQETHQSNNYPVFQARFPFSIGSVCVYSNIQIYMQPFNDLFFFILNGLRRF